MHEVGSWSYQYLFTTEEFPGGRPPLATKFSLATWISNLPTGTFWLLDPSLVPGASTFLVASLHPQGSLEPDHYEWELTVTDLLGTNYESSIQEIAFDNEGSRPFTAQAHFPNLVLENTLPPFQKGTCNGVISRTEIEWPPPP